MNLPLPDMNPNALSGMSIITSMLFLLSVKYSMPLALTLLFCTLLLDWFDGMVARKFNRTSEEGHLVDIASDRLSEGIVFVAFFPWFCLFTLNCLLSLWSVAHKRHLILPLRHVFLVFYMILMAAGMA